MNDQWFYIQQWKRKRWAYIGKELSLQEAKSLWSALIDDMANTDIVKPLAYVRKGNIYKVVMKQEDGWETVACNAMFLNGGSPEPLLAQRINLGKKQ